MISHIKAQTFASKNQNWKKLLTHYAKPSNDQVNFHHFE